MWEIWTIPHPEFPFRKQKELSELFFGPKYSETQNRPYDQFPNFSLSELCLQKIFLVLSLCRLKFFKLEFRITKSWLFLNLIISYSKPLSHYWFIFPESNPKKSEIKFFQGQFLKRKIWKEFSQFFFHRWAGLLSYSSLTGIFPFFQT